MPTLALLLPDTEIRGHRTNCIYTPTHHHQYAYHISTSLQSPHIHDALTEPLRNSFKAVLTTAGPATEPQFAHGENVWLVPPGDPDALAGALERLAADPALRVAVLQHLLGDGACRQLGIYPLPAGFKLSVVIPVYNEERWLAELVRRVQVVPNR